jgi:hypothetical protein
LAFEFGSYPALLGGESLISPSGFSHNTLFDKRLMGAARLWAPPPLTILTATSLDLPVLVTAFLDVLV